MVGSSIDGEDVAQEAQLKAVQALEGGAAPENFDAWLFRIARNTAIDHLRAARRSGAALIAGAEQHPDPGDRDALMLGFELFMQLPETQRCAVILKDVLGHSIGEIAMIAEISSAAAKSALQRGRTALREMARQPDDAVPSSLSQQERVRMARYVGYFQAGDFDAIRTMLAEDVRVDLVGRLELKGLDEASGYFTRYAAEPKWRYQFGLVERRAAMLVFDAACEGAGAPSHFALIEWKDDQVAAIRDFLFAPYTLEGTGWRRLA